MAQRHIKHTAHLINLQDIVGVFLGELYLCCRQFLSKICKPYCGTSCGGCGGSLLWTLGNGDPGVLLE